MLQLVPDAGIVNIARLRDIVSVRLFGDVFLGFAGNVKRAEKISDCILVLDTLKFLVSVAWEGKLISNKHCEDVSLKLEEAGKMFGGWKKNLGNPEKKNRDV